MKSSQLFDVASQIEGQVCALEQANAVLEEVYCYFYRREDFEDLPHHAEHILLLLYVTGNILQDALPEMQSAINKLYAVNAARADRTQNKDE